MTSVLPDTRAILTSQKLSQFPEIRCGFSTRLGGVGGRHFGMNLSFNVGDSVDNVRRNREAFFGQLGVGDTRLASPVQCHSADVQTATRPGKYESCDALITDQKNLYLSVSVADCVPIFLYDCGRKIIAAIHAGWRGSSDGITRSAVKRMQKEFNSSPEDTVAYIGPSAGLCCYEVGEEVAERFSGEVQEIRNGKTYLDLKAANERQLLESGVRRENIEVSDLCTICSPELLHSYRRDRQRSGRMLGVIGITT